MAIEFSCPSCQRPYKVKDELGGKTAKCGKCGNRMQVPKPVAPEPVSAAIEPDLASWMAEELTAAPVVPPKPKPSQVACPKCGLTQQAGAMICSACGANMAPAAKPGKPVLSKAGPAKAGPPKKRLTWKPNFQLGFAGSLMRGTMLSVVFALVGAMVWAVIAYLTQREFGFIAIALGGLTGFGMSLGHEDDDGTTAGIVAAFVSLFGIVAAKVLIIVVFLAAAVANVVANVNAGDGDADPNALARTFLATAIAEDAMREQGIEPDDATGEQRDAAMATARAEIADLDEEGIAKRFEELGAKRKAAAQEVARPASPGCSRRCERRRECRRRGNGRGAGGACRGRGGSRRARVRGAVFSRDVQPDRRTVYFAGICDGLSGWQRQADGLKCRLAPHSRRVFRSFLRYRAKSWRRAVARRPGLNDTTMAPRKTRNGCQPATASRRYGIAPDTQTFRT